MIKAQGAVGYTWSDAKVIARKKSKVESDCGSLMFHKE